MTEKTTAYDYYAFLANHPASMIRAAQREIYEQAMRERTEELQEPPTSIYENAMRSRIERWLPAALERQKELKAKIARREDTRARTILQRQLDELGAQIRAVQHELEEPATAPAEMYRGNTMRAEA